MKKLTNKKNLYLTDKLKLEYINKKTKVEFLEDPIDTFFRRTLDRFIYDGYFYVRPGSWEHFLYLRYVNN